MAARSSAGSAAPEPRLPPLLPGWPLGRLVQGAAASVAVALALAAAYGILRVQVHYVESSRSGHQLSALTQLLADGSSLGTSVGPWVAAVLFLITAVRVLSGPPEPPIGAAGRASTIAAMRRGLRRELEVMRWVLLAVTTLALLDCARMAVDAVWATARHSQVAQDQLTWTPVEALGLLVAAVSLGVATRAFRAQVSDLGALAPPPV